MEKIDLKKELKHLYQPLAKEVVQVDVPAMNFLMVDGVGTLTLLGRFPMQLRHYSLFRMP